jgi:serine/threonine protein kinase
MMKKSGKGGKAEISVKPEMMTNSFVGTEEYIAPEVIEGTGHTSSVDWWTVGILTYEMLVGHTPYRGDTRDQTFDHILHAGLKFPDSPPVSSDCKALLKKLLHPEPKKRLGSQNGAPEIKSHKWFKGINWALIRNEKPPMVPRLNGPLDTSNFRSIEDPDLEKPDVSGASPSACGAPDPFENFTPLTRHGGGSMQRELSHSQIHIPVPKQASSAPALTQSSSAIVTQQRLSPVSPPPSSSTASAPSMGPASPPVGPRSSESDSSRGKRNRQEKAKKEKKEKKTKKDGPAHVPGSSGESD